MCACLHPCLADDYLALARAREMPVLVTRQPGWLAALSSARVERCERDGLPVFDDFRMLALDEPAAGGLERVRSVPHVTVFTRCADAFTQLSEVADAASEVIHSVLGDAGRHTRTSIGVYQLPKGATVELELVATLLRGQTP